MSYWVMANEKFSGTYFLKGQIGIKVPFPGEPFNFKPNSKNMPKATMEHWNQMVEDGVVKKVVKLAQPAVIAEPVVTPPVMADKEEEPSEELSKAKKKKRRH